MLRLSATRLAGLYITLFGVGICVLLLSMYILTTSLVDREVFAGVSLCILLAAFVGVAYCLHVRKRVLDIVNTCESIITGQLSRRLHVDGSRDEFDSLAIAVNRMLDRLEQQTQVLRTTFDSAAHDLRAPLYRARVRIEETLQHPELGSLPRATMEATLEELERVQRTLGTLLQIAQAEGQELNFQAEPFDLAQLTREIVDLYRPEASARVLTLNESIPETVLIRGSRQLFAQTLVNLLENSLKYVPSGGRIAVVLKATDDSAELEVSDNGPGIPVEDRERVLRPFARLERDRAQLGSGLGLSLASAVMRLHRAELRLLDGAPGLVVRCQIPLAS